MGQVGTLDTVALRQLQRKAVALGALTYLSALSRGDSVASSGLLLIFQRLFNDLRPAVTSAFADPAQAEREVPRLEVTGRYEPHTALALSFAIYVGTAAAGMVPIEVRLPDTPSQAAVTYQTQIAGLFSPIAARDPGFASLFQHIETLVTTGFTSAQVAPEADRVLRAYAAGGLQGIEALAPTPPPPVTPFDGEMPPELAAAVRAAGAAVANAGGSSIVLPTETILARPSTALRVPDWAWWLGLGTITVLGAGLIVRWKRKRR